MRITSSWKEGNLPHQRSATDGDRAQREMCSLVLEFLGKLSNKAANSVLWWRFLSGRVISIDECSTGKLLWILLHVTSNCWACYLVKIFGASLFLFKCWSEPWQKVICEYQCTTYQTAVRPSTNCRSHQCRSGIPIAMALHLANNMFVYQPSRPKLEILWYLHDPNGIPLTPHVPLRSKLH